MAKRSPLASTLRDLKANHGPADYTHWHAIGLEDASADFEKWEKGKRKTDLDFDFDDLVTQYTADRNTKGAAYAIAARTVDELLGKLDRQLQSRHRFAKRHKEDIAEDELDDEGQHQAHLEWQAGYREGLVCAVYIETLDSFAEEHIGEDEDEDEEDEDEDAEDEHENPRARRGAESMPMSKWYDTGVQDADNVFDEDSLEGAGIDLAKRTENIRDAAGVIQPELVHKEAAVVADLFEKDLDENYEAEWVEQNQSTLDEEGHLPSEAWKQWKAGYRNVVVKNAARWLEEEARRQDEE